MAPTQKYDSRRMSVMLTHPSSCLPKNCCSKSFIIFSVFLSATAVTCGILASLVSHGCFANIAGLNSINNLSVIGDVNSYLLGAGGMSLFIISVVSWVRLLKNEKNTAL